MISKDQLLQILLVPLLVIPKLTPVLNLRTVELLLQTLQVMLGSLIITSKVAEVMINFKDPKV